jgi:Predicted membrane protein (DUF2318).
MGKKSRENKEKRAQAEIARRTTDANGPVYYKKKGLSNAKKMLIGLALIVIVVVAASVALSENSPPQTTGSYPTNVSPVTYTSATVSSDGQKVTVPLSYVNSSKLVFVDLKLKTPLDTLQYQDRTVPLTYYRDGQYLPLVIISTPSGKTVAGIRTCEPCGSFSFHIVKGANLKCDVCGAEWSLEDFSPVSGGCATYPPPKLSTSVDGDSITVDLSALSLQFAA